jgi:hypothetical protein
MSLFHEPLSAAMELSRAPVISSFHDAAIL